jgi:hypothetical protein
MFAMKTVVCHRKLQYVTDWKQNDRKYEPDTCYYCCVCFLEDYNLQEVSYPLCKTDSIRRFSTASSKPSLTQAKQNNPFFSDILPLVFGSFFLYPVSNQNYWVFALCPSAGILETRKERFGDCICFRPQVSGGTPTLLGPLESDWG